MDMTMIWSICMDMIIVISMGQKNIITSMSIAMRQQKRMWQYMDMIMEMKQQHILTSIIVIINTAA